jgi:hypothetical protein
MRRGLLVAGTERGAFVSLDDGDSWQPLQLNLPVTSVRDFRIHDDDLIVGTHGRGIWVIDDISPLRQTSDAVLRADAFLFKPATAIAYVQGDDNGTPMQKDEPLTENRPVGAFIDYYLRSASSTPVTLEILDARGAVVKRFSSEPAARQPVGRRRGGAAGSIPRVSSVWDPAPGVFSAGAGLHRVVWNPVMERSATPGVDGAARGGNELLTGTFTARLTAGGKTYTEAFAVKPDPRVKV